LVPPVERAGTAESRRSVRRYDTPAWLTALRIDTRREIGELRQRAQLDESVQRVKSGGGSVQVFAPGRAYIVPLDLDANSAHDGIVAIVEDFADGNTDRRGDMTHDIVAEAESKFVDEPATKASSSRRCD
jgi:hypothetical protein